MILPMPWHGHVPKHTAATCGRHMNSAMTDKSVDGHVHVKHTWCTSLICHILALNGSFSSMQNVCKDDSLIGMVKCCSVHAESCDWWHHAESCMQLDAKIIKWKGSCSNEQVLEAHPSCLSIICMVQGCWCYVTQAQLVLQFFYPIKGHSGFTPVRLCRRHDRSEYCFL